MCPQGSLRGARLCAANPNISRGSLAIKANPFRSDQDVNGEGSCISADWQQKWALNYNGEAR